MNYKFLVVILLSVCLLSSCSDESEKAPFDKTALLENVTDNLLLPSFQTFEQKVTLLEQAASTFKTTPTTESLTALQNTWKEAILQWKRTEVFGFGPADDYEFSIYFHPARTNLIENALDDQTTIDLNYVELLGAAAKGLPALEFLIFENGKTVEEVLTNFTTGDKASRRLDYVVGITQHLHQQATALYNAWQSYATQYKASANGEMDGVSQLANQVLLVIENTVNKRIGDPLGKNTSGTPLPTKVEAYHSSFSKELIMSNLSSISAVFTGAQSIGFDDYLNFIPANYIDQSLSNAILTYLNSYIQKLEALDNPLQIAVVDENIKVEAAYTEGKMANILIKTDMFSALSITIAFTDNDGD